jgi:site-specific recombinase XerD
MTCDVTRAPHRAHISWPVIPHVLRHTFSVTAIQKGLLLPAPQRLLGHDRADHHRLSPEEVVREFREKW